MTRTPMARLADARPEVSRRPHTVVSPADRAALLRSIAGAPSTVSSYIEADDADVETVEIDLRPEPTAGPRRPVLLAAAVLLVVVAVGLGLVLRDDGGSTPVAPATTPPAPSTVAPAPNPDPGPLPAGFDPATASAVFAGQGDVNAVLDAYVASRFDSGALPTVAVTEDAGDSATATWTFGNDTEGTIATGTILLREAPEGWAVVASTIDDVDLSRVVHGGDRVTGAVSRTNINSLALDVLTPAGQAVPGSPDAGNDSPLGPFGTAGISNGPEPVTLDVPVDGQPVVLRAMLVGGTILGVAEVALDPPPVVVPSEGVGSVRVEQRVDGTCVGLASGAGRICTSPADQLWPADVWYLQLGPTVRRGDRVLITGFVNPSVSSVQVRTADGTELDGATSRTAVENGAFIVVAVPIVGGPVSVDLLDGSGQVLDTVQLAGLLPVGG